MPEAIRLDRFVRAQAGIYGAALAELQAGKKQTHWMWFIFPQILGLGLSANARTYAIHGREEARAYWITHCSDRACWNVRRPC